MVRSRIMALIFFLILTLGALVGAFTAEEYWKTLAVAMDFSPQEFSLPQASPSTTPTPTLKPEIVAAQVSRVIDGDTIELSTGQKLRYIGVDTPETVHPQKSVQCFGKAASDENKRLVENKTVYLVKDVSETDRYGRLLRYVYLSPDASASGMVNLQLVAGGFARASSYPPDVAQQSELQKQETEARLAGKGLWSAECQTL